MGHSCLHFISPGLRSIVKQEAVCVLLPLDFGVPIGLLVKDRIGTVGKICQYGNEIV